jgi:hypothetical protein
MVSSARSQSDLDQPPLLPTESFILPTLPLDSAQFYETRDLAKKALQESATKQGFTLVVRKSDRKRANLYCSL